MTTARLYRSRTSRAAVIRRSQIGDGHSDIMLLIPSLLCTANSLSKMVHGCCLSVLTSGGNFTKARNSQISAEIVVFSEVQGPLPHHPKR